MADLQIPETEHYREAIDSVRKRVPVPRNVWDDMQAEEREHAFTVTQVARVDVLQDVLDAVDKAVETGTSLDDFRAEVADKLIEQWGGSEIPGRIETVMRTNIATAYAEGRHAINSAPAVKEARPYWRYDDTDNDRECDLCHECHGVVLPADDPFWSEHHPPLHHQCECTVTALSPEEAEEEGVTSAADVPDVEADEGFGGEPSSEGRDWAPDLKEYDPALRDALEKKLAELEGREPREFPKPPELEPEATPERAPKEVPEPETTPEERKVQAMVEEHDAKHVDHKTEYGMCVTGNGETIMDKKGAKKYVPITHEEARAMTNTDSTFTHNHPNGSCLSWDDYKVAAKYNLREMRAVARSELDGVVRVHSFKRPADGWPSILTVEPVYRNAHTELGIEVRAKVRAGEMTPVQANHHAFGSLWKMVQSRLKVDLGYSIREVDMAGKGKKGK